MLQALRNGVKSPIMKVFLIFLAGGFALWGVGDMTTGLIGGSDKAISAGDESLSPREVAVEFDRTRRNYLPNATMGEALQSGLLGEVAGSLARDVVFKAEANSLGLTVTRAMQRAEVAREPSFKDANDEFSQTRFISVLAGAGLSEADYLERVSTALRREQIVDALAAGAAQPAAVARTLTAFELERRNARIVSFPVDTDSIAIPTDDQLASWFEEVKSRYDAPALRSARVGSIEPQMFADGIDISDSAIETAYADRLDEFTTPESRRVRQMVFDDMDTAQTALSRVSGGEDFAAVASDMLGWSEDDITLGLVTRRDLEGAVGDAVFDASAGEVAGPAESVFGVHLLVVDEIIEGLGRTGVVGIVKGRAPGPMIGLRCDIDALPMQERTGLPYASTNTGKMHACGHDGHTAMLLATAKVLAETRDFAGSVALIFQPAEEGGGGGREMVVEGLFDKAPCETVWGLHNMPDQPLGTFTSLTGGAMAGIGLTGLAAWFDWRMALLLGAADATFDDEAPARARRAEDGLTFDVRFEDEIPPSDPETMMARVNDRIGAWVEADPDQWLWLHGRWKRRARGEQVRAARAEAEKAAAGKAGSQGG